MPPLAGDDVAEVGMRALRDFYSGGTGHHNDTSGKYVVEVVAQPPALLGEDRLQVGGELRKGVLEGHCGLTQVEGARLLPMRTRRKTSPELWSHSGIEGERQKSKQRDAVALHRSCP